MGRDTGKPTLHSPVFTYGSKAWSQRLLRSELCSASEVFAISELSVFSLDFAISRCSLDLSVVDRKKHRGSALQDVVL